MCMCNHRDDVAGHNYERRAIERWLASSSTSPKTGSDLETTSLFPNHTLRNQIREYVAGRGAA